MNCQKFFCIFLLNVFAICSGWSNTPEVKVVLTGNTADLEDPEKLFDIITAYCTGNAIPVVWVLNGDIFRKGFSKDQVKAWKLKMETILEKFPQLRVAINQGDRDWNNSGRNGWETIQALDKMLNEKHQHRMEVFFEHGCPGPWTFSASDHLEVMVINSQWWNHPFDKPLPSNALCDITDEDVFLEEMRDILDESHNKNMLVLSHFPLASPGNYGGRYPVSSYLWPPLVGNVVVSFHQNIGASYDLVNENFDDIRNKLSDLLLDHTSLIFASSHEKSHSIMTSGDNFYVNSGALIEGKYVAKANKQALFTASDPGFIEISYDSDGTIGYQYIRLNGNDMQTGQGGILMHSSCDTLGRGTKNFAYLPCAQEEASPASMTGTYPATTEAVAGPEYAMGQFGEFFLGKHYRASWTDTVTVPYLNMDTTFQGLVIDKKGGGRQTTSLKMDAGNGRKYVFRSVDKNPVKALDYSWRGTLLSDIIKDQTTTQQPYGALATDHLLDKIGILHAKPHLYLLPPDEKLGVYKEDYGNLLGMLEDAPSDKIPDEKIFGGADHIEKSFKLFQKLYNDHDNQVDRLEFCRARVFDILVGDWGKHEDNWKWAGYKVKGGETFRPIPRDRDHVFSRWDGLLPWLADREWAKPSGENFDYHIKGLRSLMYQARHMDRLLGSQLTRQDWINAAKEIQQNISDEDIDKAIHDMPEGIFELDGKEIADKLKVRIRDLQHYAEQYYLMLAKEVDVVGSSKAEYFHVVRNSDGSVKVTVYDLDKKAQQPITDRKYYERTFYPGETREVRLYGLMQDDVFFIEGKATNSILVRVIGGMGDDAIIDQSEVQKGPPKTLVYEKENSIEPQLGSEAKTIIPKDEDLYHYRRTAFVYNTYFPLILLGYNPFNGFVLNASVSFTNHNFSKPDFSAKHEIKGFVSTEGNYELSYENRLRYAVGKWDAISEVRFSRPFHYNYFFGIGNNTENDEGRSKSYYRSQYNSFMLGAGLVRDFWKKSEVSFLFNYELNEGLLTADTYLADNPNVFGLQQLSIYSINGMLDLDFRDSQTLPQRGFRLYFTQSAGHIPNASDPLFSISELKLEEFFSTYNKNPVTLGVRLGGGATSGDLPYYKLLSLGQLNDLHGFKRNRFTGDAKAFLNTELRYQILKQENTRIPFLFGVRGFYDVGRVWPDSGVDPAVRWHQGYGGGFYLAPFTENLAINVSVGRSKEEPFLFMFGIGNFLNRY